MVRAEQESARWAITRTYLANAETARIGLGRIDPAVLNAQIAQVSKTFGLKQSPAAAQVWNTAFLPEAVQHSGAA